MPIERLFVIWLTEARSRRVIGELWRDGDGFAFAYRPELAAVHAEGVAPLPEFPHERQADAPYRSRYLFSTFAQRLPSPARADYGRLMASWGVRFPDDPLEALARSGGVQVTDRLELAEHRDVSDPLAQALEFRMAGERFVSDASEDASTLLLPGDGVSFRRELANPHDVHATYVVTVGDRKVGWVPSQYSELIARHLERGTPLVARVERRLLVPPGRDRWVVSVRASH